MAGRPKQTHCQRGHELAGENLYTSPARDDRPSGELRRCRECRRVRYQKKSPGRGGKREGSVRKLMFEKASRFCFLLSLDSHRRIGRIAYERDMVLSALMREIVDEWLERNGGAAS